MNEYNIAGLTIAVALGLSTIKLASAFVADAVVPVMNAFSASGKILAVKFNIAGIIFPVTHFAFALMEFTIVLIAVAIIRIATASKGKKKR
ncbi:MAG: hypothetical protein ACE5DI_03040 [Candidatus Micrarchaeia archaeon]